MDETEKDYRKAFEDVTTRNVQSAIQYGNDTRKIVRELEDKLSQYDAQARAQDVIISQLQVQITGLQSILFRGGTS
jgi:phosphoenolpyruvate carboxylase